MLYIFGCGIYTVYRQTWNQFLILLVAEFFCFVLFVGATAIVGAVFQADGNRFSFVLMQCDQTSSSQSRSPPKCPGF